MTLNDYQEKAASTAKYPQDNSLQAISYTVLGLCGEAGEVAEKVKKIIRDSNATITEEKRQELKKELGDVIWYISETSRQLGFTLEEVAQANVDKLQSRNERGVISGSGDNR